MVPINFRCGTTLPAQRLITPLILAALLTQTGCGGEPKRDKSEVEPEPVQSHWQKTAITRVSDGGLLSTHVAAVPDQLQEGLIHFVYLLDAHEATEEEPNPPIEYTLKHLVWDSNANAGEQALQSNDIVTLDNTLKFDLTIDANNNLYVAYRGGNNAHCNTQQSDTMLATLPNGAAQWSEYLGAMGYSGERNPAYTDGDAGDYPSLKVDSAGNVHIAFQFFWEGCDSNNALHPDVRYIQKPAGSFDSYTIADEEAVEGNTYSNNYQNAVGYHNSLILDADENPVVFYGAREINYDEHGLRMAQRNGGWQSQWVDRGCIIEDVSAALSPSGELAVAYYIDTCTEYLSYTEDDEKALRYATLSEDGWQIQIIDEATKTGSETKLTFNSEGEPAIVYYETESYGVGNQRELYNLKLATYDNETEQWFIQRVDEAGDIGLYNSVWFDSNDLLHIVSFSKTDNTIYLFNELSE